MPIISTQKEISTNADSSRHVVVRMFDQDGVEYMYSFFAAAGADVDGIVAAWVVIVNMQLADMEFEQMIGAG